MNQIAQAQLARDLRARKANQRAENIAATISVSLQINQHGIEVIEVIGSGEEGCNIEAIRTWVKIRSANRTLRKATIQSDNFAVS